MTDTDEAIGELDEGDDNRVSHRICTRSQKRSEIDRRANEQENKNMIASRDGLDPILRPESISPQRTHSIGANEEIEEASGFNFHEKNIIRKESNYTGTDEINDLICMNEGGSYPPVTRRNKTLGSQRAPARNLVDRFQRERSCGPSQRSTYVNRSEPAAESNIREKGAMHGMSSFQDDSGEDDDFTNGAQTREPQLVFYGRRREEFETEDRTIRKNISDHRLNDKNSKEARRRQYLSESNPVRQSARYDLNPEEKILRLHRK
jgi:hypothetical protein